MGTTAMSMDVVCENSGHQVVPCAPNMCITPAAPSPLPMPYPITGTSSSLDPATEKTDVSGKKVLTDSGKVKQMRGNEPGTQKDIVTMTTDGTAWTLPVPAFMIRFEDSVVAITGNSGFGNTR